MYANAAGIVPVIQVFVAKGISRNCTCLYDGCCRAVFTRSNLAKKVMTWKLIGIFFGTVTIIIIVSGFLV